MNFKFASLALLAAGASLASAQVYEQLNSKTLNNVINWAVTADTVTDTAVDAEGNRYVSGTALIGGVNTAYLAKVTQKGFYIWRVNYSNSQATSVALDGYGVVYVSLYDAGGSHVAAFRTEGGSLWFQDVDPGGYLYDLAGDERGVFACGNNGPNPKMCGFDWETGASLGTYATASNGYWGSIKRNAGGSFYAGGQSGSVGSIAYWDPEFGDTAELTYPFPDSNSAFKELTIDPSTQTAMAIGTNYGADGASPLVGAMHSYWDGTQVVTTGSGAAIYSAAFGQGVGISIASNENGVFLAYTHDPYSTNSQVTRIQQFIVDPSTFTFSYGWADRLEEPTAGIIAADLTFTPSGGPLLTAISSEVYGTAPDAFAGYTQFSWTPTGDRVDRVLLGSKLHKCPVPALVANDIATNQGDFGLVFGKLVNGKTGQFSTQYREGGQDFCRGEEDQTLTIGVGQGLLRNDGNKFSFAKLTAKLLTGSVSSNIQSLTVNNSGSFTVVPAPDYDGETSFQYEVKQSGVIIGTYIVSLHFKGKNDAPVAINDTGYEVAANSGTVNLPVVLNDVDVDGDILKIVSKTNNPNATIGISSDKQNITFKPKPGFQGDVTFSYTIKDPRGLQSTATVTVGVN